MSKNKRIEEDITSRKEPKEVRYTFIDVDYNGLSGPRWDHRYEGTCLEHSVEDADDGYDEEKEECCRETEEDLKEILKLPEVISIEADMGEKGDMYATIKVETSKRECALSILRVHDLVEVTSVQDW